MLLKEEKNDVNVQNTEKRQYAVDGLLEAKENKIIINLYNTIEHAKRNLGRGWEKHPQINANLRNNEDQTAFMIAMEKTPTNIHIPIVKRLHLRWKMDGVPGIYTAHYSRPPREGF